MAYRLDGNTRSAPAVIDLSPLSGVGMKISDSGFSREASLDSRRWRSILRSFPEIAQERYRQIAAVAETDEAFQAGAHSQKQDLRLRHSALNAQARALSRQIESTKPEHQHALKNQLADVKEEIAEVCEAVSATDFDLSMRRAAIDPAPVKDWMARRGSRAKTFTAYEPDLPAQSTAKDEKTLAEVRTKIDGCAKAMRDIDLAPLPGEDALEKALAEIDKIATASAPDFSPTTRLAKNGLTDQRTQGTIKWPTKHVRLDEFEPDPFRLIFWLFGDEIKERARAEIKKLQRPGALSLAERAEKKAALENERLGLWRIEEALVTRLREAGRSDINYRSDMPIPVFLRLC